MAFDCVERPIANGFRRYGSFVARHPVPFIVFPLLFTIAMAVGFLQLDPVTDAVYLFTPTHARSKFEREVIHEKWPLQDLNYVPGRAVTQAREVQITVLARDGGNILEPPYSEAVYRFTKFIERRIRIAHAGRTYSYADLCLRSHDGECPGQRHVHVIADLFQHGFNVSFPTVRIGTESGYLGSALGGVSLRAGPNGTNVIAKARAWFLVYHLKFVPHNVSFISGLWENELGRQMRAYPEDPYIEFTYFHSQTLPDELKRNADSLVPRFVVAFAFLILFSVLCSLIFVENTMLVDWVLSKPLLSVLGVLNAGMGIVTGVGALLLLGMVYNDIVAVMPFLVVAVGTDNMFLMVAAVRRTSRNASTSERMGDCMSEAAVSILITALTDAFSFGVGAITTIPAVQIFCVYTAVAIMITFFYQITFFTAWLALFTEWEREGKNCLWVSVVTTPASERRGLSLWTKLANLGSRPRAVTVHPMPLSPKQLNEKAEDVHHPVTVTFFNDWYAPVLMHPLIRGLVLVWFAIYLTGAAWGCTQIREGLEPVNLLVEDSYAIPHYRLLEKYFWHYGATLQVVVNNAPDLRDPEERSRVMQLVKDIATTSHSAGRDSVQFWLLEMERYYRQEIGVPIVDSAIYGQLQHFIAAKLTSPWRDDVKWGVDGDGAPIVTSFRFLIGLRDISSTTEQQEATRVMRELATRYPTLNVTTFMPLWLFTDQYDLVIPNTIQNIVIALACMILIAGMLIPQPLCALWVALACASIDFGVIGYMTLWGVNLDAISMITIIMSIGFSVDYSAHITYGYVVSVQKRPAERVREALAALGWPLFQGGASTILATVVLANVPAYMIVTFFKTVFLAISIGLVHGLVFLPVFLSIFIRDCCFVESSRGAAHRVGIPASRSKRSTPVRVKPTPMMSPIREEGRKSVRLESGEEEDEANLSTVTAIEASGGAVRKTATSRTNSRRTSPVNSPKVD